MKISINAYNSLEKHKWLVDDAIDFLVTYLFRGASTTVSHFPCNFYSWFVTNKNQKKKRINNRSLKLRRKRLERKVVFIPINLDGNHWVLAVIIRPTDPLSKQVIVYLDPLQPHNDINEKIKSKAKKDREEIYENLVVLLRLEKGSQDIDREMKYDFNESISK
jgi:Ulp1 family protease